MVSTARWFGPNTRERLGISQVVTAQLAAAGVAGTAAAAPVVKTAAYTLIAADAARTVEVNSATAKIITIPANIFTAGQQVRIAQVGVGQVSLAAGAGFTLTTPATLKASAQWSVLVVTFRSATAGILSGEVAVEPDIAPTAKTADYTLIAADAIRTVEANKASAIVVTVPADVFAAGQTVNVVQVGAGLLSLLAGDGVTLTTPTTLDSAGQWSTVTVTFRSATAAVVSGGLAAA